MVESIKPTFLKVKVGNIVSYIGYEGIKEKEENTPQLHLGIVCKCIGSARDPKSWSMFQVIEYDSGKVEYINADCVENIL